uniref:Uncharacterized protein n=1 Tax=viral metagenome TaxID=1070528 RepID=A0A6M3XHY2_9ZZZZ
MPNRAEFERYEYDSKVMVSVEEATQKELVKALMQPNPYDDMVNQFNPDRQAPNFVSINQVRDWLKLMTPQERLAFIHKAMDGYCSRCGEKDDERPLTPEEWGDFVRAAMLEYAKMQPE